jgi:DivIVA domain-containing protein
MTGPVPTQTDEESPFPRVARRERGYDPAAVDVFLRRARAAFEGLPDAEPLGAEDVRRVAFPLRRGGYAIAEVDAALTRLEDAFAQAERAAALAEGGARRWVGQQRDLAQEVLNRLVRPRGRRFDRVGIGHFGYRVDEVDLVADRVAAYLSTGEPIGVDQVRDVAFRMQRRGYREQQVDAVLDAVVGVILAIG